MTTTSVRVALRVRPLTAKETLANEYECLSPIGGVPQVILGKDRSFTYDHVFWTDSAQNTVYDDAVAPLLDRFMDGFNATVLAYGQTGSGKTFSMGTGLDGNIGTEHQGIVPRAIHALFAELPRRYPSPSEFSVAVSFLELYNEELIDLLNPSLREGGSRPGSSASNRPSSAFGSVIPSSGETLRIREDEFGNIVWMGVREEPCESPEQLFNFLNKGSLCRTTGSTDMNMVSSRSHAIFSVTLRLTKNDPDTGTFERIMSKFHFVDLAGSERLKRTHAEGARAKEGIAINSGLLALGNVISALGDESRLASGGAGHVPYRDSKLTRLLQDSLGGNSQTLMLACVSPADTNFQETLSTLKYANRARNIKNKVTINPQSGANSVEVQQLRTQITRLKLELATLKDQYGLAPSNGGMTGTGLMSASGSYDNLAKLQEQHSLIHSSLRNTVSDLQNERSKLEVHIHQLQLRIQTLEKQLVLVQAERDALLMEKNGWSIPDHAARGLVDGADDVMDTDEDAVASPPNPLLTSYLTRIAELQHSLSERETELTLVKHQASLVSSAANAAAMHGSGRGGGGHGVGSAAKPFKFVLPSVDQQDAVSATLQRARNQIQADMKFLLDSTAAAPASRSGSPTAAMAAGGSGSNAAFGLGQPGDGNLEIGQFQDSDRRPSALEAMDVPTWARTPTVAGGDDTASQLSGSLAAAAAPAAPEVLHRALHKIQADLAVKEELMARLEATHRENLIMRDTYEDKLGQLQQALVSIKSERDQAVARIQDANPREKERDIRARYELKVKQLLSEISVLRRNHMDATKAMTSSKKAEMLMRQLRVSVDALRAEKARLIKKMRLDADKSREAAAAAETEIQKLRKKERAASEMAKKYERNFELQKVLLKRRAEELVASNQKLKAATAMLKRSTPQFKGGISNNNSRPSSSISARGELSAALGGGGGHRGSFSSLATSVFAQANGGGFPDSSRPMSSSGIVPAAEQSELALSYRKHQLYKEMDAVVATQQQSSELEHLVSKRKRLSDEKVELLNERDRVVLAEATRTGQAADHASPQYMDERLEAIDAELSYIESRIRVVQSEVVQADTASNGVSGYDAVIGLVRTLSADEATQLLEALVDDFIQVQISARNQAMEVTRQETQIETLRKNLLLMRKTAMKNAVDYEKRIKTIAVDRFLDPASSNGDGTSGGGSPGAAQMSAAIDQLVGISMFAPPPSANGGSGGSGAGASRLLSGSPRPSTAMSYSSSRPSSPAYSLAPSRRTQDDDAMSVTSSVSASSPAKPDPTTSSTLSATSGGPREYRSMSVSSTTSSAYSAAAAAAVAAGGGTGSSSATAPRRVRPQSATGDVFERLAKTYTVAAQAKVRDSVIADVSTSASGSVSTTIAVASLSRRESHERLNAHYQSTSIGNLALTQIHEERPPGQYTSSGRASSGAASPSSQVPRRSGSAPVAGPEGMMAAAANSAAAAVPASLSPEAMDVTEY
ncbi:hypothetical protein BC828DRAFT_232096 [Blastocladiella britannica]|nr:hypothetical protein BC828DRAFT_232096 [Blastocladiella britannica]